MHAYGESNIGLKRKNNQDSFCIVENDQHATLAVVCDGIGGGKAGDVASSLAANHLKERFTQAPLLNTDIEVKHWFEKVIQEANDLIFTQSTKNIAQKGMGTTMVGVFHQADTTYIFNVGDSRTYGLFDDDFLCLTEDHSFVADLLKRGEVSEEEALNHPNRNVLTNALGIWNTVKIDISKIKENYTSLLVCSDGLHGYVEEKAIREVLEGHGSLEDKVKQLIQMALQVGGYDNVSVIVLEKEEAANE